MSGPYEQQQQLVNQAVGATGGQFGGQVAGFESSQFSTQAVSVGGGQYGGQVLSAQPVGQTYTQTSSTYQAAESYQAPQAGVAPRQRSQRNDSSSSSSSSDHVYNTAGAQGVVSSAQGVVGSAQQYAAGGESFATSVTGQRRAGRHQKQVIRLPDQQQGQVRQVRHRLPTPEPDTLERIYVQRAGNEVVEEITEIPTTPPPRVQERTVVEPAGPPQVVRRTIRVPPRGGGYGGYQVQSQQGASFASGAGQPTGNLLSAGSYGNVQQAFGGQQQAFGGQQQAFGGQQQVFGGQQQYGGYGAVGGGYGAVGGGYGAVGGGYGAVGGGYGAVGGGYQQQGFGGFPSSPSVPFGIPPNAHCFYV